MNSADPSEPQDTPDDVPTVWCSRCDREFRLGYELDELQVGNQAVTQFALDHHRHTGHYPDDARPWVADCQQCPATEEFLSERPAKRFAETHARHTRHAVKILDADGEGTVINPDD